MKTIGFIIILCFAFYTSNVKAQKRTVKRNPLKASTKQSSVKRTKKPVTISCGICNSEAINLPKPDYPKAAKAVRASGEVAVQITINEKGNVVEAYAKSGHALLYADSVKAALKAKFKPTTLSGIPVRVIGTIIYKFRL